MPNKIDASRPPASPSGASHGEFSKSSPGDISSGDSMVNNFMSYAANQAKKDQARHDQIVKKTKEDIKEEEAEENDDGDE